MQHDLKTWPQFYAAIASGEKRFELRNDDRHFKIGDTLRLREWHPVEQEYTGRETNKRVSYLLRHDPVAMCAATFGLQPGYVILSLENQ